MEGCQQTQQPVVLRTWQMESPHNYENSRHENTVFVCPGATSFEVEFDERCETEKRCEGLMPPSGENGNQTLPVTDTKRLEFKYALYLH